MNGRLCGELDPISDNNRLRGLQKTQNQSDPGFHNHKPGTDLDHFAASFQAGNTIWEEVFIAGWNAFTGFENRVHNHLRETMARVVRTGAFQKVKGQFGGREFQQGTAFRPRMHFALCCVHAKTIYKSIDRCFENHPTSLSGMQAADALQKAATVNCQHMIALREPILYPLGDQIGSVELIQHVGDDAGIAKAARVSFAHDQNTTEPERDFKLIKYLLKHGHGSPFEHNLLTFRVTCPIFVDRQWVRHRIGVSKNEESGRYIELKERCYIPQNFRRQAERNRQASVEAGGTLDQPGTKALYEQAWRHAYDTYTQLLAMGVAREQARGILPLSLYTSSYYTFNVRSLLHFLELRDHEGAQYEIQRYAKSLSQLAEPLFPLTFQAWRELQNAKDPPA